MKPIMTDGELTQQAVTLTIDQALQHAVAHHQAGELHAAEHIYRAILQVKPDHPDANHNLGVLAAQIQQPAAGLLYLKKALEAGSIRSQYWVSYIDALIRCGQTDVARQVLEQARQWGLRGEAFEVLAGRLDIDPDALKTLASFFAMGQYHDATILAQTMTVRFPLNGVGWEILGAALQQMGAYAEALEPRQKAAALLPCKAEVHSNLGNTLWSLGRLDEAETSLRRALEIKPDFAEAHGNLGNVLRDLGRTGEAEANYRRALQIESGLAVAHNNLGVILQAQGRHEEAEACLNRALKLNPNYTEAHCNLGNVLKEQGRLGEALASYRLASTKEDWQAALYRLTTPQVLLTGLALGSWNAPGLADAGYRVTTSQESVRSGSGVKKSLRIILIYPPPWQIPSPGDSLRGMPFGPPRDRDERILADGDFQIITYGLLTIAAQAKHAGYDVSVYNLSTCPWRDVETLIAGTEADVYGISAFTANRRGMGAVAALIRQQHPLAHITVGGPFVTALPLETLRYYRDIDTAVIGEGEDTFMELLACLGTGRPAVDICGSAWRIGEEIVIGKTRQRIKDLDSLASPFDYFTSSIVMTSRGCPSKCTFCGSFTTWGKLLRFHSAASCLDIFKKALARLSVPFIAIKDDTFTAHRRRTLAICDSIIENKMNFLWSCDTRVDSLDDELLRKMRMAGCQMISLGVESGAPSILKAMRKETTPEMVLDATRSAQKYGMNVRYYMILGNRGETAETIQQSINLIKAGRPTHYSFSALSFFPGTEDWAILSEKQGLTPDVFFKNDFKELTIAKNRHKELQDVMLHVACGIGSVSGFDYTVEEREAVAVRLPHLHSVHVELASAYFRAGRFDQATIALNHAEDLGFPINSIIYNLRACIALAQGETGSALALLERACQPHSRHIGLKNLTRLRAWAGAVANERGKPPALNDSILAMDFDLQHSQSAHPTAM